MTEPYETIRHRGYTIEVHQDPDGADLDDALSGGEATLYAWHRRYRFGEPPPAWATEAMEEGRLHEAILDRHPGAVILPVYMLDHSGLRFSTGAFGDPWDSGQLGVIWAVPDGGDTEAYLRAVVREIDDRASGNVWGYRVLSPEGSLIGSCWGFVGNWREDDGLLSDARAEIDHEIKRRESGERLVAEAFAL